MFSVKTPQAKHGVKTLPDGVKRYGRNTQQAMGKDRPSVFLDDIVSRFAVVVELKAAQYHLSKVRNRFHLNDHQVLTISDLNKVVVTNQWTVDRFRRFCQAGLVVGMKVKADEKSSNAVTKKTNPKLGLAFLLTNPGRFNF